MVEAADAREAIQFARRAHEAFLRDRARWLPAGLSPEAVTYRIVGG